MDAYIGSGVVVVPLGSSMFAVVDEIDWTRLCSPVVNCVEYRIRPSEHTWILQSRKNGKQSAATTIETADGNVTLQLHWVICGGNKQWLPINGFYLDCRMCNWRIISHAQFVPHARKRQSQVDVNSLGPHDSVVYFLADEKVSCVKIGTTTNMAQRISDLSTGNHNGFKLLLTIPGGKREEASLHKRFKRLRVSGEWFRYTGALQSFVDRMIAANAVPDVSDDTGWRTAEDGGSLTVAQDGPRMGGPQVRQRNSRGLRGSAR